MTLRRWTSWLLTCALLLSASWACLRIGRAFEAVEEAARATQAAMQAEVEQYRAVRVLPPPPR